MLNIRGDTTIVWTEDRDEEMEAIIQKKMDEGCAFFIVEPRFFGLLPSKKTKLEKAADAKQHRALSIPDEDFAKFVSADGAELVSTPAAPVKSVRKTKSAKEVAKGQSVGVRPMRGG